MNFKVNGKTYMMDPMPGEMLSTLLRERLRLTGTKIGCNEAECGACTVIIDGDPIVSCTYPSARVDGKEVLTIEGLAGHYAKQSGKELKEGALHPLQEAFIAYGAVQCGFCIPGQIMTAHALIEKNPRPQQADLRSMLKDTLCRCAGYPTIERAVLAAAESMADGLPIKPPDYKSSNQPLASVGTIKPRPDVVAKVNGDAVYTDDLVFEGMLHARVKRCGIPHGLLMSLDVDAARALPGVAAVLTAEDIPGHQNHGLVIDDWPAMVGIGERVRYVADAVAIVAADTRETAGKAIELIKAEYTELEVVGNPVRAKEEGSPRLHDNGNMLKHIKVRKGDVERGFASSDIVMKHTFHTPATEHAFIEPECSIAVPLTNGRMEIYVGSQIPYDDRKQVAAALGLEPKTIRVIGQLMGGGFGGKEDIAGQIHSALLAQKTGQPVKLLFDRHESFMVHPKRHATQITVKIGAMRDGKIRAVRTELYGDTGAYASLGAKVMERATTHSSGPYEIDHVKADCYAMYTNNPPAGAFRGFGALQGQFAIENMMDRLAERLNMDPIELRRKNALRVGSRTNTGQELRDSVGLLRCIDTVKTELKRLAGDNPFKAVPLPGTPHRLRAWGFAASYKNTGLGGGAPDKAGAEVELLPDGTFQVRTASAELGQGLVTVLQLIAAEELKVDPNLVDVLVMDTDLTPDGGPTTASRQSYVTGNAALYAARNLRKTIIEAMCAYFGCDTDAVVFKDNSFAYGGKSVAMDQAARIMKAGGHDTMAFYEYSAPATQPLGKGGDMHFAFSFAAQAAEVEVDAKTGEVRVLRVIVANDVGKALNPLGLQGQIEGGVVMGVGHALTENFIVEGGYPFTDHLSRYRIPNITQVPEIISIVVEDPTREGPYGAKGVGEIVSIPTIPAITNAVYNAVGTRIDTLPIDQELIRQEAFIGQPSA
ncbi:MAG: aldehyde oxidoreductase [spirochete symbiont of Stewartia floridana]|nr:MAG: aldehyde oxidoreductase [spirochete symbiont of Stewartia floridana]